MRTRLAIILLTPTLACGPQESETTTGGSTDTTASSATSGEPAPTTGAPDSSTGVPPADTTGDTTTTGPATTEPVTTGPATTEPATTTEPVTTEPATTTEPGTTTEPETTTTSDTGTSDEPVTKAWWVQSMPLQIRVQQTDPEHGLCRGLLLDLLARGGADSADYSDVERPEGWGISYIFVHDNIDKCLDPYQWYENEPAYATTATGSIIFNDVVQGQPGSLDLDVTGLYAPIEAWIPMEDDLTAFAVPVDIG